MFIKKGTPIEQSAHVSQTVSKCTKCGAVVVGNKDLCDICLRTSETAQTTDVDNSTGQ